MVLTETINSVYSVMETCPWSFNFSAECWFHLGTDRYDHIDTYVSVWIRIKPLPIYISNQYICLAPYQTDADTDNRFKPIFNEYLQILCWIAAYFTDTYTRGIFLKFKKFLADSRNIFCVHLWCRELCARAVQTTHAPEGVCLCITNE